MRQFSAYFLIALAVTVVSCTEDTSTELKQKKLAIPTSEMNAQILGRMLFYDNSLSLNNSVSCASCHKQELAFSDNVAFSVGYENVLTSRNSMPIQNAYSKC